MAYEVERIGIEGKLRLVFRVTHRRRVIGRKREYGRRLVKRPDGTLYHVTKGKIHYPRKDV